MALYNLYIQLIFICSLSILNSGFPATILGNETDLLSLLEFKAKILEDPLQILSSWNESISFCQWRGVTCDSRHQRVSALNLKSQKLVGSTSPYIGNLSFLLNLQLQNNSLSGEIPPEIGRLPRLQILMLSNNSIGGQIPSNISKCSNLSYLDVSYNRLVGNFPVDIGFLSNLMTVIIHNNNLTGNILPFGNMSSLRALSAAENNFDGGIPDGFGRLKNLQTLALGINMLSGEIPPSLLNLSSLKMLDVTGNKIQGSLPSDLGYSLPKIEFFNIGDNQFTGPIPVSISNATNLHYLIMLQNNLKGKVPNLERLYNLEWLSISYNHLGYGESDDLSFLSSLSNATNLQLLSANVNKFGGVLPESIGNLSTNLRVLYLDNNQISGSIPSGIANIVNLESLYIQGNQLTGIIPAEIGKLQNLQELNLIDNKLSGEIPSSLGNLSLLNELILGANNLEGSIPASLGECQNLQLLFLAQNNLSGTVPKQVAGISSLSIYLDLSQNQLSGSIPTEVGNLKNLNSLDFSDNQLSGQIPSTLGSCVLLGELRLGSNFLEGEIPSSLSSLRGIQELDLSNNNLSGEIPVYLEGFNSLQSLNLSFNNFEGLVPAEGIFSNASALSVVGNSKLCGGVAELQLPKCNFRGNGRKKQNRTLILALSIPLGLLGLALVMCVLYSRRFRKTMKETCSDLSGNLLARVSYQSLFEATDGFSASNLIGAGSFGSVYKGVLDGKIIAVKVLNLLRQGASKSFISECEALRNIRHRNLVKVLTVCSSTDYQQNEFKALVYEFMVNGSLDEWLHPDPKEDFSNGGSRKLNLLQRLNIAIDVASALNYLHNHSHTPIVHCDLKPSNILLDKEMNGHVGDFGLAKLLPNANGNETSSIGIRGSIGYTAPEYGMGSGVSTYGDVYSIGVLLLEMFTGKRPTDDMFKNGVTIHSFVKKELPTTVSNIADPILVREGREEEEESSRGEKILELLTLILEIGISCSVEVPRERMDIDDVIAKLHLIKDNYIGM